MSSAYSGAVLEKNPVAYWRLGETAGQTAADETGNGHDGTYFGNPTLGQPGAVLGDFEHGSPVHWLELCRNTGQCQLQPADEYRRPHRGGVDETGRTLLPGTIVSRFHSESVRALARQG